MCFTIAPLTFLSVKSSFSEDLISLDKNPISYLTLFFSSLTPLQASLLPC